MGFGVAADNEGTNETDADIQVVIMWSRMTLREWESTLTKRAPVEQNSTAFKTEKAQYRQSKQYLKPLRRALRDAEVQPSIVRCLAGIAACCKRQQYREAKEAYMRLAIGNSPWPMGVTFVTFHDRPNRHNIAEESSAHVLDDETTRKYVQMVKRLITFCE